MFRLLVTSLLVLFPAAILTAQTGVGSTGFGGLNRNSFSSVGGLGSRGFGGATSGLGSGSFGTFGVGAGAGTGQVGNAQFIDRSGTFIGGNSNARQGNFIGAGNQQARQGTNRTAFGNAGGFTAGGRGQAARGQNRGNQPTGPTQSRVIRTKLSVGFQYARIPSRVATRDLEAQLAKLVADGVTKLGNVSVTSQGTTVILRGQVASPRDRDLAVRMARFEPGVDEVKSELVVLNPSE